MPGKSTFFIEVSLYMKFLCGFSETDTCGYNGTWSLFFQEAPPGREGVWRTVLPKDPETLTCHTDKKFSLLSHHSGCPKGVERQSELDRAWRPSEDGKSIVLR